MKLFDRLFRRSNNDTQEHIFKHNVYDPEISQYSPLPRFYYIDGKKYDIDSPESVSEIPLCHTSFDFNGEKWGIDAILREHVNRYYSHIPEPLKAACYPKISDLEWGGYRTESPHEKISRLQQLEEQAEREKKLESITLKDMKQFDFKFNLQEPFVDNRMSIILVSETDQHLVKDDLMFLSTYVSQARDLAKIEQPLELPIDDLVYAPQQLDIGTPCERIQYYTYFQCEPYTKTRKLSKYPLVLHYGTKNMSEFDPEENCFGHVYYMQDGSIGKCTLIFWKNRIMHCIELSRKGTTLTVKKVEKGENGIKDTLYKD